MEQNKRYTLITALSMVVGTVIGSGIFFKADDIVSATGGNALLGILGFLLVGVGTLFGALVISQYAINSKTNGGFVGYAKDALGPKFSFIVGWGTCAIYLPAFIVVLAYVATIYIQVLFGFENTLFLYGSTVGLILLTYFVNIKAPAGAGKVQSTTAMIKVIPLFVIAIFGLFVSNTMDNTSMPAEVVENANFFSSLIGIAFAFDGWIIATSIAGELKNAKKNLPLALLGGIAFVTVIYAIYFFGVTRILPADQIIALGDGHISAVANQILGPIGAKVITMFVIISVYGTLNGMILVSIRLPHALVEEGSMKNVMNIKEVDKNTGLSKNVVYFNLILIAIYVVIQYCVDMGYIFSDLSSAFDISSIPIVMNYIFYIILYVMVTKVVSKPTPFLYFSIIIAVISAGIVLYGGMLANGLLYLAFTIIAIAIGYLFFSNKEHLENN